MYGERGFLVPENQPHDLKQPSFDAADALAVITPADVDEILSVHLQGGGRVRRLMLTERDVPDYLEVDHNKMVATFVRQPTLADVPYPVIMQPSLVVEFYAKNG